MTTSPPPITAAAAGGSHFTVTSASGRVSVAKIAAYEDSNLPAVVKLEICSSSSAATALPAGTNVSRSSPSLTIRISCLTASCPAAVAVTIGRPLLASHAAPAVAAVAVAVAGSQATPPISMTSLPSAGCRLGVSPSGVTGTTKVVDVPLAPAPVQVPNPEFGSTPSVPSAQTSPSISGSRSLPSVAVSGVVNGTSTGVP